MNRAATSFRAHPVSHADFARFGVIGILFLLIAASVALEIPRDPGTVIPQLFYIPILYAAYFYPRSGLYLAGICAIAYEIPGSIAVYPNPFAAAGVIGQGVLFIIAATVVAHLSDTTRSADLLNRQLQEQMKRDNERRRGVIITVAHELRTPLQPLMGYLNLILQDPPGYGINTETQKILGRCLTSVERERMIINRMLEFSVLESGKVHLDYTVFTIRDVIENVVSAGDFAAKAEIVTDVPGGLTVEADAGKIGIIIDSLLANAIAYSRPPRKIRISLVTEPGSPCHRIAIQDNGIGIPADLLDSIFEPFQLADSAALSRKYDRIGLSLSIAQKYLRMHGGFISVSSTVNKGSTFTLHIPRQRRPEDLP